LRPAIASFSTMDALSHGDTKPVAPRVSLCPTLCPTSASFPLQPFEHHNLNTALIPTHTCHCVMPVDNVETTVMDVDRPWSTHDVCRPWSQQV
jgi:hypothetical protein